jgi:hypothetical protein
VKVFCKRHWRTSTIVFLGVLVMLLAAVVVVQAVMLRSRGWTIPIGSVPDWLQAVGTVAAFGALFYAAQEWRAAQNERRAREADQARLVLLQTPDPGNFNDESIVVRNHSAAPIYDVQVYTLSSPFSPATSSLEEFLDDFADPAEAYAPVLPPGGTTVPPLDVSAPEEVREQYSSSIDFAAAMFTDALGRRWWRFGKAEPTLASPEWTIYVQ